MSKENLNTASCQAVVTRSFSLMILEAEYHKLKLEIFKAEKEMALSPNEYSHNFLNGYKPHLKDLEKALSVLQNCAQRQKHTRRRGFFNPNIHFSDFAPLLCMQCYRAFIL